jgi:hypothetical protein
MLCENNKNVEKICSKTGRRIELKRERHWPFWLLPFVGLVSLLWFLIRVIPKPSRATYPCQRVAAPLASGFFVWLIGIIVSSVAYRKARRLAGRARYVVAGIFAVLSVTAIWWSISVTSDVEAVADFVPIDPPNSPIGVGKGIHPGRVVWVHDPSATTWDGVTGHWWDEQNIDQQAVDNMVSRTLRALAGEDDDAAAWDAIFRYFNRTHGAGDVGYQPGEKIAIKINLNEEGYGPAYNDNGRMPSPQMIHSLLAQLFDKVHISGADVTIYDASRAIADPLYNRIHGDVDPNLQNVRFVANATRSGRIGAVYDPAYPVHFANPSVSPANNATGYLPTCVTEAKYLIDMALFSAHSMYGVTACGKNWYGSICWRTNANYWPWNGGWTPSPLHNFGLRDNPMGSYNPIVDLIGHPQLGGKTLLYLVDGLYGSDNAITRVLRFRSFENNWTASIFASQDPLAIDSVMVDFLRNEPLLAQNCTGQGVDNYLHEAAQADNPPSGSFYDPGSTGSRLASLGVHEHWNNAVDKQYARNLGESEGIELVTPSLVLPDGAVTNTVTGIQYNYIRDAVLEASDGDIIEVEPGIYEETVRFSGKALRITSQDPYDANVVATTIIQSATFAADADANSVLQGFTISGPGQGIYCEGASPWIDHCCIVDNVESGITLWAGSNPLLTNCVIAGNGGDGIEMWETQGVRLVQYNHATILYCDILGNRGNGIHGGEPTVDSTIIRANGRVPDTAQIIANAPTVSYSNVQGGWPGDGNIDVDPNFVTPGYWAYPTEPNETAVAGQTEAVWVGGDYHLQADSPCIDAGNPVPLNVPDFNIEGLWYAGSAPDIGAYEFGLLHDTNN